MQIYCSNLEIKMLTDGGAATPIDIKAIRGSDAPIGNVLKRFTLRSTWSTKEQE